MNFNEHDIMRALRHVIAEVDYDLYKSLAEDKSEDHFQELVDRFIEVAHGDEDLEKK